MKNSTGSFPRLEVATTDADLVSQAGGVLLVRGAQTLGLDTGLVTALAPWTKPLATHRAGKVVLDLAMTLALGGDCLADAAVLRAQPGMFGRVGSDATVSRAITTLATEPKKALRALKKARAAARPRAWAPAGEHAPSAGDGPLGIDLDATLVTSHSDKEHAAPTFRRGFGFHRVGVPRPRPGRVRRAAGGAAAPRERRVEHRRRPHHRHHQRAGPTPAGGEARSQTC